MPKEYLFLLFIPAFIGMWLLITYIISRLGWAPLAKYYAFEYPFEGEHIGMTSAKINLASYENSVILKFDSNGLYLKTFILFKLFHTPLYIPWTEIVHVREKKLLFMRTYVLTIGNPKVASITLKENTYHKFEAHYLAAVSSGRLES